MPRSKSPAEASAEAVLLDKVASAKKRLRSPWKPIESAPTHAREILVMHLDGEGYSLIDFARWDAGEQKHLHRNGQFFWHLVAWMPRPPVPGTPRHP